MSTINTLIAKAEAEYRRLCVPPKKKATPPPKKKSPSKGKSR